MILALTAILYAADNPYKRIRIIAPTGRQARIMMNYVIDHLTDSSYLTMHLPDALKRMKKKFNAFKEEAMDALEKELSKTRITFTNHSEIMVLSAHGKGKGAERVLGEGGDLIIVDESPVIEDEVFNMFIRRMLGDSPDSVLVQIGNPIKINHFYEDWHDEDYLNIHIGWEECVKQGRFTQKYVDEQARKLGGWDSPAFRIMYCAEFVEEALDTLIPMKDIDLAVDRELKMGSKSWFDLGVDVARFGVDLTVLTDVEKDVTEKKELLLAVREIRHYAKQPTTNTTGCIIAMHKKGDPRGEDSEERYETIKVDDLGLGGGVTDQLEEQKYPVEKFVSSERANDDTLFENRKSEAAWQLRLMFLEGRISIPEHSQLIDQLKRITYEFTSKGRIKIIDPKEKSPDFFDSLMMAAEEHTVVLTSARVYG